MQIRYLLDTGKKFPIREIEVFEPIADFLIYRDNKKMKGKLFFWIYM